MPNVNDKRKPSSSYACYYIERPSKNAGILTPRLVPSTQVTVTGLN
jgi:hypothetical protein